VVRGPGTEEAVARHQAAAIERYWMELGFEVTAWAERLAPGTIPHKASGESAKGLWAIRSDMVNGHPIRKIES
jgi:hypothetical protein